MVAQAPQGKDLGWAYPVPDPVQPPTDEKAIHRLPGSSLALTQPQIDDLLNPPDWFPNQHPPAPKIVLRGNPPDGMACGSCHLMSGEGHPESAGFAGQSAAYIIRQMEYFKSGARKDYLGRMDGISKAVSAEDVRQAAEWFAALKPTIWTKVVEADMVPKSVVVRRMRLPAPGGGKEPLGKRIITLPQDAERVENRDPHTGFIAYTPKGSLKKGESLVRSASDKTIQCAVCPGEDLRGIGDVPRIAGLHPNHSPPDVWLQARRVQRRTGPAYEIRRRETE